MVALFPSLCANNGHAIVSRNPIVEDDSADTTGAGGFSAVFDVIDADYDTKEALFPPERFFDGWCRLSRDKDEENHFLSQGGETFLPKFYNGSHLFQAEEVEEVLLSREDVAEMWSSAQMNKLVCNSEVLCDWEAPYLEKMQYFNDSPHHSTAIPADSERYTVFHLNKWIPMSYKLREAMSLFSNDLVVMSYKLWKAMSLFSNDLVLVAKEAPGHLAVVLLLSVLVAMSLTWLFQRMGAAAKKAVATTFNSASTSEHLNPTDGALESPSSAVNTAASIPVSTTSANCSPTAAVLARGVCLTPTASNVVEPHVLSGSNGLHHRAHPVLHRPVSPGAHSMSTSTVTMDSASTQGDNDLTKLFQGLVGLISESLETYRRNQGDNDLTKLFQGLVGHISESLETYRRNLQSQSETTHRYDNLNQSSSDTSSEGDTLSSKTKRKAQELQISATVRMRKRSKRTTSRSSLNSNESGTSATAPTTTKKSKKRPASHTLRGRAMAEKKKNSAEKNKKAKIRSVVEAPWF